MGVDTNTPNVCGDGSYGGFSASPYGSCGLRNAYLRNVCHTYSTTVHTCGLTRADPLTGLGNNTIPWINGDSGGPVIVNRVDGYFAAGIVDGGNYYYTEMGTLLNWWKVVLQT
jgi:hypothetical protein